MHFATESSSLYMFTRECLMNEETSESKHSTTSERCPGDGKFPQQDPFGREFSPSYEPSRYKVAGKELASGFLGVLEGIQADQDYLRIIFKLQHYYTRKMCCHYCNVIQWVSSSPAPGEPNSANDLFTVWGPSEENRGKLCSPFSSFLC